MYTKEDIERLSEEYVNTKSMLDKVTTRLNELKEALTRLVDEQGQPDEKGNLWLPAGNRQLKKERRSSLSFDEESAEQWAKSEGIFNDVKRVIFKEVVDEDKLLAYAWEHREASPIIESFNKEKVTWAFKVVEKKAYIDES
jgi:hypothetical protein